MYDDPRVSGRRRNGLAIGTLVAIAASMLPGSGEAGEVSVNIQVDEAFVELIRGIRRAEGIDAPDAAADQRLRLTLERIRGQRASTTRSPAPPAVPVVIPSRAWHIGA